MKQEVNEKWYFKLQPGRSPATCKALPLPSFTKFETSKLPTSVRQPWLVALFITSIKSSPVQSLGAVHSPQGPLITSYCTLHNSSTAQVLSTHPSPFIQLLILLITSYLALSAQHGPGRGPAAAQDGRQAGSTAAGRTTSQAWATQSRFRR